MTPADAAPDFRGTHVLALESRRAKEVAALIATYGGRATVAPALREVAIEPNDAAIAFAATLVRGEIDIVIFLTGVGARALLAAVEREIPRESFLDALRRTRIVARGPKPLGVLRELQTPVWIAVPEPNTWRELLAAIDAKADEQSLRGARVAVQEYGVSNLALLDGLAERGATVLQVPVYRWAMPEDLAPLRNAVTALADGQVDVVFFTTGVQVAHLWQLVSEMQLEAPVRRALTRTIVASIGPSTSEELQRHDISVDFTASHPKFGMLIRELAERSAPLLESKRGAPHDRAKSAD